eukprot:12913023-Prorocentrum_lima.AAC.1
MEAGSSQGRLSMRVLAHIRHLVSLLEGPGHKVSILELYILSWLSRGAMQALSCKTQPFSDNVKHKC